MQRIEQLAADPKTDPDQLWAELVHFCNALIRPSRRRYRAAELMSKVRSPLDALDRKLIPKEDRPPQLPENVVAVLGEYRGRHQQPVRWLRLFPNGKWLVGGSPSVWDTAIWRGD